ncbi:DNA ligase D [Oceanobacillus bengalensis]|uniref:DNA ligase (ATP) n=1 Tax=Oceanobacillus bengalensis TaxID=1435466 RepID=A0A494YZ07_9BACI|nr:DNA ligase D [Oceanobacillus bengalensis]RKQ15425.1 DNA ligase D [Oceanobacillus bengalensis]
MEMMKPIASSDVPHGDEWIYEVKYDGFRCILFLEKNGEVRLTSKNKKDLTSNFPEIVVSCQKLASTIIEMLPLKLDGELVVLNNAYQSNFTWIQKRGRLKNSDSIQKAAKHRPATFIAFDILQEKNTPYSNHTLIKRKEKLQAFFEKVENRSHIKMIPYDENPDKTWKQIVDYKAEGIIAKRKTSKYIAGKKHQDWFKIKNWRTIQGILTHYDAGNGYYSFRVYDNKQLIEIGKVKHGLDTDAANTLKQLFLTNGEVKKNVYSLPPAVCASIHTLDLYKDELREPEFVKLLPNTRPEECTIEKLQLDLAMIPERVGVSNSEKLFWPINHFTKGDLLCYIREISPYMLPFTRNHAITFIRCPDGVDGEQFYQKHLPDYAPPFIDHFSQESDKLIICNHMDSLVWFANHGAMEYHVPFQFVDSSFPKEIVFDLDPPGRERFDLAIQAAQLIKPILDDLGLVSFVKTSGNKGLQIHIPIREESMTYDETAIFTQAIAYTVESAYPDLFTTERMKKKRNGRLYIDYVQHAKDKTIIAPYSPRRTDEGTVATPLLWEEVQEALRPEQFTIGNVVERVQTLGCPWKDYFTIGEKQKLDKVLRLVRA